MDQANIITFDSLRKDGLLLFEYIRGSQLYGLSRPESDTDRGGIYIEPLEVCLSSGIGFPVDLESDKNDDTWYSFKKYMSLLVKSNPTVLESLYIPEDKILFKHPIFDLLLENKEKFITKACFNSFMGYAKTQIEKARSLKKKIVIGHMEEKSIMDFVYYRHKQGSRLFSKWLGEHGMKQRYCGLVNVPNMIGVFSVYYDWGAHFQEELKIKDENDFWNKYSNDTWNIDINSPEWLFFETFRKDNGLTINSSKKEVTKLYLNEFSKTIGYKGMTNKADTSNQLRLSSIPKGRNSIIDVSYYQDGYQCYCSQYRSWKDFEKNHNEERFNLAKEKQFDRKNMSHAVRLLHMGIEIARGEGLKVDRTGIDRDFIMKVRLGETDYDTILGYLENKDQEMKEAMENSTIPEEIDLNFVDDLMIKVRKKFYGLK